MSIELIDCFYVFQGDTSNMGNIYRKLWDYFNKQEARIIMVGLDGAGKTTILYHFKLGDVVTTIPTIGKSCTILMSKLTSAQLLYV